MCDDGEGLHCSIRGCFEVPIAGEKSFALAGGVDCCIHVDGGDWGI